jgi:hypothetical protein
MSLPKKVRALACGMRCLPRRARRLKHLSSWTMPRPMMEAKTKARKEPLRKLGLTNRADH